MDTKEKVGTKGPWELDSAKDGGCRYYIINGEMPKELSGKGFGYTVADTMNRHYCISPEEDAANALLISKAPEMAELLREWLDWMHSDGDQLPRETECRLEKLLAEIGA